MTAPLKFVVTGDDVVAAQLKLLAQRTGDLSSVFNRIAADVANKARSLVPRRSGALASSITPSVGRTRASISSGLIYSGVQEYGWPRHHIAANLFLHRAADDQGDRSAEAIAEEIQKQINQAGLG
jgi:hypothetical protein